MDRLGEEIVGAGVEALHPFSVRVQRRYQDDGQHLKVRVSAQGTADRKAVHPGHDHIQQDQIGDPFSDGGETTLAVARAAHLKAVHREQVGQQADIGGIVVHDQNIAAGALAAGILDGCKRTWWRGWNRRYGHNAFP